MRRFTFKKEPKNMLLRSYFAGLNVVQFDESSLLSLTPTQLLSTSLLCSNIYHFCCFNRQFLLEVFFRIVFAGSVLKIFPCSKYWISYKIHTLPDAARKNNNLCKHVFKNGSPYRKRSSAGLIEASNYQMKNKNLP